MEEINQRGRAMNVSKIIKKSVLKKIAIGLLIFFVVFTIVGFFAPTSYPQINIDPKTLRKSPSRGHDRGYQIQSVYPFCYN